MALDRATQQIDGTLNAGFTELSDHLQNLTDKQARSNQLLRRADNQLTELRFLGRETNRLLAGINQRLELLLEEQRIANVLQENIAQLLRIPDSQKQRQFHLEMGLKFFANASKDADLYHDALKELLAAEALMPGDYFVLHQIGMLYLYAVPLVDLARAAEYLTKAAKYASVESHPDAVRLGNVLAKSLHDALSRPAGCGRPLTSPFSPPRPTAMGPPPATHWEIWPKPVKLIQKAVTLDQRSHPLRFFQARYLAAAGKKPGGLWPPCAHCRPITPSCERWPKTLTWPANWRRSGFPRRWLKLKRSVVWLP